MRSIYLGNRKISADDPCYIIAEIGVNHNGDVELARQLVDKAVEAGADAVKFQKFNSKDLLRKETAKADYQTETTGAGTQNELLAGLELSLEDFKFLRDYCASKNIGFISTAFDAQSLRDVAGLNPICLKWPSGEITNIAFLKQAAKLGLPVLLSTGMADLAEITTAVEVLRLNGLEDIVVLQCVSNYPASPKDQNLKTIQSMASTFEVPTGFSDHTIGTTSAIAARALGMAVLEKHFTLDVNMEGPDHRASIEPEEFAAMVRSVRQVEEALGDGIKKPVASEEDIKAVARKSLVYSKGLQKGHVLLDGDLTAKRPNDGVSPALVHSFVGRSILCDVKEDELLEFSHFGQ